MCLCVYACKTGSCFDSVSAVYLVHSTALDLEQSKQKVGFWEIRVKEMGKNGLFMMQKVQNFTAISFNTDDKANSHTNKVHYAVIVNGSH